LAWPPPWNKAWTVLAPPTHGQGPIPKGLEPGDVILCSPVVRTPRQHVIVGAQSHVFAPESAAFTHAAIYAGNGLAYDSTFGTDVACRPFSDVTDRAYIRVRRFAHVTPTMQWDICSEASALKGKYNLVRAVTDTFVANLVRFLPTQWTDLLADLHNNNGGVAPVVDPNAPLYCSQLVERVYGTQGITFTDRKILVPLPGALSEAMPFDEVPISW